MNQDLNSLSDEELFRIAGINPNATNVQPTANVQSRSQDLNSLSDDELFKIAGIKPPKELPKLGRGQAAFTSYLQGGTLGFADEITGAGSAAIAKGFGGEATKDIPFKELYKEARDTERLKVQAAEEQYPVQSFATGFASSVPGIGSKLVNYAGKSVPKLIGGVAALGATSGLGSSTAEDTAGQVKDTIKGGIIGAGLAVVAPPLIKGATALANKVVPDFISEAASKISQKITGTAEPLGNAANTVMPKSMQKIVDRLKADYPDEQEFKTQLNSYLATKDKSLIEAGGARTRGLGEGSAMYPSGGAKAYEFFTSKVGDAGERLKKVASRVISPHINYNDTLDAMVEAGQAKASPLYKQSFKKNQSVQSAIIDKILNTPEGKSALDDAARNIQNKMALVAKTDPELTALAKDMAKLYDEKPPLGGVASGLKLETLDQVKRSMDNTIKKAFRAGDESEARRILNLKTGLVRELDRLDKTKLYSKARKVSGDYLSNKEAMDQGLNFRKEDEEIIKRSFDKFGSTEKESYRVGVLKDIRTNIDEKRDVNNVTDIFARKATRNKLKIILSEKQYSTLQEEVKAVDNIYKLRNQLTGNSRTAARQIAAEEFDSEGQDIVTDLARNGASKTAIDRSIRWITRKFDGLSDKAAAEVADVLFETSPKKKFQIVKQLIEQYKKSDPIAARKLEAFYGLSDKINKALAASTFATTSAINSEQSSSTP